MFVCVCILSTRSNLTLIQLSFSVFAFSLRSNVLFFGCGEGSNGEPYSCILFFFAVKFTQDVPRCYYRCWRFDTVQLSIATTDRCFIDRVWSTSPLNARRLSNASHSESGAFSRGAQIATNTQTLLRSLLLTSSLRVWMAMMMMGAIRSARPPSSSSTVVRKNSLFVARNPYLTAAPQRFKYTHTPKEYDHK